MTNNSKVTGSISVSFNDQKNSLSKEPTGDVKKEYWVGCYSKEDWEFIHEELKKDGSLEDNIPTESCECCNDCLQSEVRGMYLLTDTEVNDLKKHPRVKYVHIHAMAYPGTYMDNPDMISASFSKTERYSATVKHKRDMFDNPNDYFSNPPQNNDLINKGSWQLMRHIQQIDPWYGINDNTIINNKIEQYGTGVDVDVIVCDTDMWFGHIEFQNPSSITSIKQGDNSTATTTVGPSNYVGTNLLKSGFATSATTGTCGVLDVLLEGPYYIDPAWFEADTSNRLEARWDGTTVPVESVAREWWSDASKRSAAFSSVGTIPSSSMTFYTRARCNGTNTAYNSGNGTHGTPCASQAYGRQFGWAYNCNKWFFNLYGSGNIGWENGFDLLKIFHQNKPNRSSDNTKNPTISSNSWGHRQPPATSGHYYFRQGASGGTGVSYSSYPNFMNFYTGSAGESYPTDCRSMEYVDTHAAIVAGGEMIDAGIIFICSAGNNNQKMVKSNHPDYNNYVASGSSVNFVDAKTNSIYSTMGYAATYNSQNRKGYPGQMAVDKTTTPYTYKTISIGALDNDNRPSDGKERKVSYSNMGDEVDCFAAADTTLGAAGGGGSGYYRNDSYYNIGSTQSILSYDTQFNGTSSACPIAAGIIATKLQYNRTWTYADVKSWLSTSVTNLSSTYLYTGTEATTATDSNWSDYDNLQGAEPKVIWDVLTGNEPGPAPSPVSSDAQLIVSSGQLFIYGGSEPLSISLNN